MSDGGQYILIGIIGMVMIACVGLFSVLKVLGVI